MKSIFDARYPVDRYPVELKSVETVKDQVDARLKTVINAHANDKGEASREVVIKALRDDDYETLPMMKNMIASDAAWVGQNRDVVTYGEAHDLLEEAFKVVAELAEPNGQLTASAGEIARMVSRAVLE